MNFSPGGSVGGESVGEFCADKIHMATKLRDDLFTTDDVFEKAVFVGILMFLSDDFNEIAVRLRQN